MRDVLLIYLLTLGIKVYAYVFSGFTAILADAFHSVIDISLVLILMISNKYAVKRADHQHPFGHELAKNVASLSVGVGFIAFMFFELMKEGILKVLTPPSSYGNVEMALLAETSVLLLLLVASLFSARRAGIINRTLLFESLNDSLSTLAAIVGVVFVSAGYAIFDGLATIAIALLILHNSLRLVRYNAVILLGKSPSEEFYSSVESACREIKDVRGVHDMVGVYTGENSIHLDLHVTVDGNMTINEADKLSYEIAEAIREKHPEVKHISIHFCPHEGQRRKIY